MNDISFFWTLIIGGLVAVFAPEDVRWVGALAICFAVGSKLWR
jgi:hypothetical protein